MNGTHFGYTREEIVTFVSIAYVVISILMVLLFSLFLCLDGQRSVVDKRSQTHVIHMLAQAQRGILQPPSAI